MTDYQIEVLCERVRSLTQYNYHTQARQEIACAFNFLDNSFVETFKGLDAIHEAIGHLPHWCSDMRRACEKAMFEAIEKEKPGLTEKLYKCL